MRLKLFLLFSLMTGLAVLAQQTGLRGMVVDSRTGAPISEAKVILDNWGTMVETGPNGDFSISNAHAGNEVLLVLAYGYKSWSQNVVIVNGAMEDMGTIRLWSWGAFGLPPTTKSSETT